MAVIILVRGCFFILPNYGIPIEWVAALGALVIIMIRWYSQGTGAVDVILKTPWHIFIFAFSMYLVVFGLRNVNLTGLIIELIKEPVSANLSNGVLIMGALLTVMSNLFNNLPSVMLGTITVTQMGLEQQYLQVAYLANILGSDIGSLILPSGTLASLIWMHILKQNEIPVTWKQYISVTILIIPVGLLISLLSLYWWVLLIS
jgi:arsenical pump membrane protein